MILNEEELLTVTGGASKVLYGILAGLGALVTLVAGIIDGYLNPLKCNMRKR